MCHSYMRPLISSSSSKKNCMNRRITIGLILMKILTMENSKTALEDSCIVIGNIRNTKAKDRRNTKAKECLQNFKVLQPTKKNKVTTS